jgi:hypothetical protein
MAGRRARIDGFARARYLRRAGHVALGLWVIGWVVFAVLVGTRADNDLISAVAVLICVLFAISFALHVAARRVAWRELTEVVAREDLSASRSRGRLRVR